MGKAEDWRYGSRVSPERRIRLSQVIEFDEVISAILGDIQVTGYTVAWGTKPILQGCRRAELEIAVSCETCDTFFNSPAGYRAQYYIAPTLGISQNTRLIESLLPRLLDYVDAHPMPGMALEDVKKSLGLCQAKIWIREVDDEVLFGDELTVDLIVDRWVREATLAWAESSANEQRHKAVRAVLAPVGTVLEVKGGWITRIGEERLDPDKISRAEDIFKYGFS
jgi:hypothetical protein